MVSSPFLAAPELPALLIGFSSLSLTLLGRDVWILQAVQEGLVVARRGQLVVLAEDRPPVGGGADFRVFLCHGCSIVPVGPNDYPMSEELTTEKPTRLGGKTKAPLIVKMRIEEQTAMRIMASKPDSLSMGPFCAMLAEYGLTQWEKAQQELTQ